MDSEKIAEWASKIENEVYTIIEYAAKNGHLHHLKFLNEKCKVNTLEYAVCSGKLEVVEWVYNNGPEDVQTFLALGYAAGYGYLDIVKFLYPKTEKTKTFLAIKLAILYGKIDVLNWIVDENDFEITNYDVLLKYAMLGEYPEVIKWIYERQYQEFTEVEYINSAKKGYTNIVKFFYQFFDDKNIQMTALYAAIENGNTPLAFWLNNKIEKDYNKTFIDYTKIAIKTLISTHKK